MIRMSHKPTLASLSVATLSLALAAMAVGCHDSQTSPSSPAASPGQPPATLPDKLQMPATAPVTMVKPPMPSTMPAMPAKAAMPPTSGPAMGDMTHVISKDEPYFSSMPSAAEPPAGTLTAGTKALLLVPGAKFSKVMTDSGTTVYVMTDGLEPIHKK